MKFYSWNVNGIRAVVRKGTFQKFIAEHQPDILCLQETKAEKGQAEIDLADYHEYWNSAEKKGYSGTAIFSKQEPTQGHQRLSRRFAKKFTFADELKRDSWNEGRVITAEFEKFYAVTVYTPNAKDDLSRVKLRHEHWDPAFLAYVKQLEKKKPVIFCGDLNVAHTELDLANPKSNRARRDSPTRSARASRISSTPVSSTPSACSRRAMATTHGGRISPTARARNIGWRIDYVLVSASIGRQGQGSEDPRRRHGLGPLSGQHRH